MLYQLKTSRAGEDRRRARKCLFLAYLNMESLYRRRCQKREQKKQN